MLLKSSFMQRSAIKHGNTYTSDIIRRAGLVPIVTGPDGECIYANAIGENHVGSRRWHLVPAGNDTFFVRLKYRPFYR